MNHRVLIRKDNFQIHLLRPSDQAAALTGRIVDLQFRDDTAALCILASP